MQKIERSILSTASLPESVVQEAATQNVTIDVIPFIETKSIIDDKTAARIQELFQMPIVAVFTSSNAVAAIAKLFRTPISWKVYSVGDKTAKRITELFKIPISATADNAAALADVIINDKIKEVYFFCGTTRHDELPEKLKKANISVNEIVVYETVETPRRLTNEYNAVIFYSPSAVHSFFSVNGVPVDTIFFAIGNTTAEAIRQYTNNSIIVAQAPNKELIVRQAIQHVNIFKEKTNE